MQNEPTTVIGTRVTEELAKRVREAARKRGISVSALLGNAIRDAFGSDTERRPTG